MTDRMIVLVAVLASFVGNAVAYSTYTLNESVSGKEFDWSEASNYKENVKPYPGDHVIIPKNVNAKLTHGQECWKFVSELGRILPSTATSYFTVSIPAGVTNTLACEVTITGSNSSDSYNKGGLVKVDKGALLLPMTKYGQFTAVTVSEGRLIFDCSAETKCHVDSLTVDSGAVADIKSDNALVMRKFFGSGEITSSTKGTLQTFSNANMMSDFSGKLTGNLKLTSCSVILLKGTESTNTGAVYVLGNENADMNHDSRLGVAKLGKKGETASAGAGSEINFGQQTAYPGGLLYLGNGEESNRNLILMSAKPNAFPYIDGGAFGGLNLTGEIEISSKSSLNSRFGLCGSNVTDCVFATKMTEVDDTNGNHVSFHIVKRGSGTWKLDPKSSSTWSGAITVEEGTLKFGSLKEAGTFCALGYGTNLFKCYTGAFDENCRTNWAIALGTTDTCGTLQYTGENGVKCTTRPIAMQGNGRIVNDGSGRFSFCGITSAGENEKTLALGGDGMADNTISGLDDSSGGAISVRKEGAGTWTLSANSSIRGDIDVQAGTLNIMASTNAYTWFRFTDMQVCTNRVNHGTFSPSKKFYMREIALLNSAGVSQSIGVEYTDGLFDVMPGYFALGKEMRVSSSSWNSLFDDTTDNCVADLPKAPVMEDESTWFPIVVRLPENSDKVTAFDLLWNTSSSGEGALYHPLAFKIEGSQDGLAWTELFATNNVVSPGSGKWLSNGDGYKDGDLAGALTNTKMRRSGIPLALPTLNEASFDEIGKVSVAARATLKSLYGTITLDSFGVDMANGGGTVDGFAFAEEGTLHLDNVVSGGTILEKKFTPVNCTGVANLSNWTLLVNGAATSKYSASVSEDGKVRLTAVGMRLIVR